MFRIAVKALESATVPTKYGLNAGDANPPRTEAAALLPRSERQGNPVSMILITHGTATQAVGVTITREHVIN